MKKKRSICVFLAFFYMISSVILASPMHVQAAEYWPEGPQIGSESGIVIEMNTGTVLYEKNSDAQHFPASITKIMTALLAVEHGKMDDVVTFSHDSVYNTEGSGIARDVGEEMTLEQCLYGMMLESSNECAYAIAEHIGGSLDKFVKMMNEEAKKLGCKNTHFNNPHGLPDDAHYTSAHDMALIAMEAYKNETFRIICGTKTYTIPPTNKHKNEETYLQNHHCMLYPRKTAEYLYDYCVGGKTGYTSVALYTLVTYAKKGDMDLVCVTMKTPDPYGHYKDTRSLFDFCFDNFQMVEVAEQAQKNTKEQTETTGILGNVESFAKIDPNARIILPKTANFSDAKSKIDYKTADDDTIATLCYTYAKHNLGKANIIVSDTEKNGFEFQEHIRNGKIISENGANVIEINLRKIGKVVLIVLAVLLLIYIWIRISGNMNFLKHKVKRRKKGSDNVKIYRYGKRRK
ncbi:MAG: D-alanyl-D-alanine carboxypeptidase family protein [Lachnospiraceae bacterium]